MQPQYRAGWPVHMSPCYLCCFCDGSAVSLESCPKCGYAVSVSDFQCRHCPVPFAKGLKIITLHPKMVRNILLTLVVAGILTLQFFLFR